MSKKKCSNYLGARCMDGSCPFDGQGIFRDDECYSCEFYGGCEDCVMEGTYDCNIERMFG